MLFTSAEYLLVFLPATLAAYLGLVARNLILGAKVWLVCASLLFYGLWNPSHLPLLGVSIALNGMLGRRLTHGPGKQGKLLAVGVAFNLLLLAGFKYLGFIGTTLALSGLQLALPVVALPLAISFYTFTQIAYLIDCHRGKIRHNGVLDYILFVTFFPHLIAGPIVHHYQLMPQFANPRRWSIRQQNVLHGLLLISFGLAKKILIADQLAPIAAAGFDQPVTLRFFEAWVVSLSYTLQLYFDFSGYSDMAIGASLLFNIRLPQNFRSPYKAKDIQDFWRRWHITLSRFLRDYLYIPLGGNRLGPFRTYINLLLTFGLGGLWHGASWMFVIWGLVHGIGIAAHRLWRTTGMRLPNNLAWFLTFLFVNLAWVFFRARTWEDARRIFEGMAGVNGIVWPDGLSSYLGPAVHVGPWLERISASAWTAPTVAICLITALAAPTSRQIALTALTRSTFALPLATCAGVLLGASLLVSWAARYTEFIYFNF